MSSSADKVTTGTYNLQSVISKTAFSVLFVGLLILTVAVVISPSLLALLVITQFSCQDKVKDTSQLISGISRFLQKLLKYFNGIAISASFSVLLPSNSPVILVL